jgi:hypothetical protein
MPYIRSASPFAAAADTMLGGGNALSSYLMRMPEVLALAEKTKSALAMDEARRALIADQQGLTQANTTRAQRETERAIALTGKTTEETKDLKSKLEARKQAGEGAAALIPGQANLIRGVAGSMTDPGKLGVTLQDLLKVATLLSGDKKLSEDFTLGNRRNSMNVGNGVVFLPGEKEFLNSGVANIGANQIVTQPGGASPLTGNVLLNPGQAMQVPGGGQFFNPKPLSESAGNIVGPLVSLINNDSLVSPITESDKTNLFQTVKTIVGNNMSRTNNSPAGLQYTPPPNIPAFRLLSNSVATAAAPAATNAPAATTNAPAAPRVSQDQMEEDRAMLLKALQDGRLKDPNAAKQRFLDAYGEEL